MNRAIIIIPWCLKNVFQRYLVDSLFYREFAKKVAAYYLKNSYDVHEMKVFVHSCRSYNFPKRYLWLLQEGIAQRFLHSDVLEWASAIGHVQLVQHILQNNLINPSLNNSACLTYAVISGHKDIVYILLQDPRVDPAINNNKALQYAGERNCVAIIELLLKDRRVDPTLNDNHAIKHTISHNNMEAVQCLLEDPRVYFSVNMEELQTMAEKHNCLSIYEYLIDSREAVRKKKLKL